MEIERAPEPTLADELAKLNDLKQSGALDDDEFKQAKQRLLQAQ